MKLLIYSETTMVNGYLIFPQFYNGCNYISAANVVKHYYGITGPALKWFSGYLTGRLKYVEIDGISSDVLPLTTGVPQGSILGPLLFLINMNDILNVTNQFSFILYTDNTSSYSAIQIQKTASINVNEQLGHICVWLVSCE